MHCTSHCEGRITGAHRVPFSARPLLPTNFTRDYLPTEIDKSNSAPVLWKSAPRCLLAAFHCAHFTLIKSHLPDWYGACFFFETMPSRPRTRHSARSCSAFLKASE